MTQNYFTGNTPQGLDWVAKYADTVTDPTTRRHIRDMLTGWQQEYAAVVAGIADAAARADFETIFADDVQAVEAALQRLRATEPEEA